MVYDIANNKDIACKNGFIAETLKANAIKFAPYIFKSSILCYCPIKKFHQKYFGQLQLIV